MSKLLNVSSSPHVRCGVSTKNLMYDVAIAMLPATIWGVMQFGIYSLIVVVATVLSCVLSEYLFETLMHKPVTISDGSALVTGMILGNSVMDADPWRCIRDHCRKTALRRTWSELDEPGSGSEMLYADLLCTGYDKVHRPGNRRSCERNSSCGDQSR